MSRAALLPILMSAVVSVLVNPGPAFAQSGPVDLPLVLETINPCNGNEPVTIHGTIRFFTQETVDRAGGFHLKAYITSRGQGTGLFDEYVYSEEDEQEFYSGESSETSVFTSVLNHLLTSTSATDNFYMKVLLHVTVANGVPHPEVGDTTVDCRG